MNNLNKGLLGALAVQVILLAGLNLAKNPQGRLALPEPVVLVDGLEAEKVTEVQILGPSKDGEKQESVRLVRKGDGWVIGGADDFPAKGEEVKRLLGTLTGLTSRNLVLEGRTFHGKLEVGEEAYRRKIVLTSGSETTTLFLGTSPSFKSLHVRRGGDDAVYLVDSLSESDAGARAWNWVDRSYLRIPKEQVWSVTVKNEHGELKLDRDPVTNAWAMLGAKRPLDSSKVDGIVNDARDLGLETPVGKTAKPEFELGAGATVTMVTGTSTISGAPPKTTETVTLEVGAKVAGSERRYARASTSPYIVEVASYEVSKLVDAKANELLEKKDEDGKAEEK